MKHVLRSLVFCLIVCGAALVMQGCSDSKSNSAPAPAVATESANIYPVLCIEAAARYLKADNVQAYIDRCLSRSYKNSVSPDHIKGMIYSENLKETLVKGVEANLIELMIAKGRAKGFIGILKVELVQDGDEWFFDTHPMIDSESPLIDKFYDYESKHR